MQTAIKDYSTEAVVASTDIVMLIKARTYASHGFLILCRSFFRPAGRKKDLHKMVYSYVVLTMGSE